MYPPLLPRSIFTYYLVRSVVHHGLKSQRFLITWRSTKQTASPLSLGYWFIIIYTFDAHCHCKYGFTPFADLKCGCYLKYYNLTNANQTKRNTFNFLQYQLLTKWAFFFLKCIFGIHVTNVIFDFSLQWANCFCYLLSSVYEDYVHKRRP